MHSYFVSQLEELATEDPELLGEILALVTALEDFGHEIEGEQTEDPSHPVITANVQAFALRRNPPTKFTPYATNLPRIRVPYVWFDVDTDEGPEEVAVVMMMMGDKSEKGNDWYPAMLVQLNDELLPSWRKANPTYKVRTRRRK